MEEKIEILSVSLLDEHRHLVDELKKLARKLELEFGWHYLLDLSWILGQMELDEGLRVMDAGAGIGVLQWYLAERGADVVSVDRLERTSLPLRFRLRYDVCGFREGDLEPVFQADRYRNGNTTGVIKRLARDAKDIFRTGFPRRPSGRVLVYNQDLQHMQEIQDDSFDYVLAVSALEHNTPGNLKRAVGELLRVLKPGGWLLATLGAARDEDWFHQPSKGWCYTDSTLREVFDLNSEVRSNYGQYDQLFSALQDCAELRQNLADFYFQSGDNGMPWGVWDPKYQPVGISKVKRAAQ